MARKAKFLNKPYSAYWHREIPEEDAELTQVGPGTPGEYMRRFWHPFAMVADLKTCRGACGFWARTSCCSATAGGASGSVQHCAHRRTSLEYGRSPSTASAAATTAGSTTWTAASWRRPASPRTARSGTTSVGAYPTREYKGLIFAYMGPPEQEPVFPIYDTFDMPGHRAVPGY